MKKMGVVVFAVMFLALGVMAHYSYPQSASVQVPFSFHAGKEVIPAGAYKIDTRMASTTRVIKFRDVNSGKEYLVNYITRLGPRDAKDVALVFDKVGEDSFLSEVHIPQMDGFHLQGAPGEHKHVQLSSK